VRETGSCFANPHPTLGEDVAAAVVLRAGKVVSASELRQYVVTRLANFKVPRQIVFLKRFPRSHRENPAYRIGRKA